MSVPSSTVGWGLRSGSVFEFGRRLRIAGAGPNWCLGVRQRSCNSSEKPPNSVFVEVRSRRWHPDIVRETRASPARRSLRVAHARQPSSVFARWPMWGAEIPMERLMNQAVQAVTSLISTSRRSGSEPGMAGQVWSGLPALVAQLDRASDYGSEG